jgi:hypothetical protein
LEESEEVTSCAMAEEMNRHKTRKNREDLYRRFCIFTSSGDDYETCSKDNQKLFIM